MPEFDDIPHNFILEALYPIEIRVKKMFGVNAIYIQNKIYLATRHHTQKPIDNGIWIGTSKEHHESLKANFSSIRNLELYKIKKWLLLPEEADDFEEVAFKICELIRSDDPRLGVVVNK